MLRKLLVLFIIQCLAVVSFAQEPQAEIIVNELSIAPGNRFIEFVVTKGGDLRGVQFDDGNFSGDDLINFSDSSDNATKQIISANGVSNGQRLRFGGDEADFRCVTPGTLILIFDPGNTTVPALDINRYDNCAIAIPINSPLLEAISPNETISAIFDGNPSTAGGGSWENADVENVTWTADIAMAKEGGCINVFYPGRAVDFYNFCWGLTGAGAGINYSFLDTALVATPYNATPSANVNTRIDTLNGVIFLNNNTNVVADFLDSIAFTANQRNSYQYSYSEINTTTPGAYNNANNAVLIGDSLAKGCNSPWENLSLTVHDNNATGVEDICYGDAWKPYFDLESKVNGGPFHFAQQLKFSIYNNLNASIVTKDTALSDPSFLVNKPALNTERFVFDSILDPDGANQPYHIRIDQLIDVNGCVAIFDPIQQASAQVRDTIVYSFTNGPGPITVCDGQVSTIEINFSYDGPANNAPLPANYDIDFDISVNGVSKGTYNSTNPVYQFATADTGVFKITALSDQFCTGQNGDPADSIHLVYNAPIVVNNFVETCEAGNTTYRLSFDIDGGTSPYTVTGAFGGNVDNAPNPDKFTSNLIPDGNEYQYVVTDANNCPGGKVNVIGSKTCQPCVSKAGNMDQNIIVRCEGEVITVNSQTGKVLDADDRGWYVMHDGGGIGLGSVFQIIEEPSLGPFTFQATMIYGTTYYISHVVGNPDNFDNPNQSDPCLSVSQGTPIIFYEKPSASISGGTKICVNDPFTIPICFGGSVSLGDVEVVLKDQFDGKTYTYVGAPGTCIDQNLTFQDAGVHKIFIESAAYQNAGGSCGTTTGLQDTVEFRVYDEPTVTLLSAGSNVVDFCDPSLAIFNIQVVNNEGGLVQVKIREIVTVGGTGGLNKDTTFKTFNLPAGVYTINAANEFGDIAIPNSFSDPTTAVYEIISATLIKPGAPSCSGAFSGKIEFQRFRNPLAKIDLKLGSKFVKDTIVCEGTEGIDIFFTIQGNGKFEVVFEDENGTVYPSVNTDSTSVTDPVDDGLFYGKFRLPAVTTTHTYSIKTVTDATVENPCILTPAGLSVTLTVNELPRIDFRQDQTICDGDSAILTFKVLNNQVNFGQLDVEFRGDNTADPKFAVNPLDTYTAQGYGPSFTFKVKPNGDVRYGIASVADSRIPQCINTTDQTISDSVLVQVKDLPQHLVFNAEKGEICKGESDKLLVEFNGDGAFTLELKNVTTGAVTTHPGLADQDAIIVTPNATTDYKVIKVTDGSPLACIDTTSQLTTKVIVNELPTVVMTGVATEVCQGDNIELRFSVTGAGTISVVFKDNLNNQYIENFAGAGTYVVTVPNPGATFTGDITFSIDAVEDGVNKRCTNTSSDEVTVHVFATPEVNMSLVEENLTVTPFHTQICEGNTTELNFDLVGEGIITVAYKLTASVGGSVINKTLSRAPGSYQESVGVLDPVGSPWIVTITSINGVGTSATCPGNDISANNSYTIKVVPTPKAVFTTNSVVSICEGTGIQLEGNLTGNGPFEMDVEQLATDGSIIFTKTYINLQAGPFILPQENPTDTTIYRIVAVRDNSEVTCVSATQTQVKVNVLPKPSANFVPNALNNTRFIDTVCSGAAITIPIDLVGVGNVKVYIVESSTGVPSNNFTFTAGTGSHLISRNMPTVGQVTQIDYKITKVEDGTSPTCPEGNSSNAFATIYVMPSPTAQISFQTGSPSEVCEGEDLGMKVVVTGKAPVTLNYKDNVGGNYVFVEPNTTTTAATRTYNIDFTPLVGTTRIDPVSVFGGSGEACVGTVSGSLILTVNPKPEYFWIVPSTVYCDGSTKQLILDLRGNGPFDVIYDDPNQVPSLVFLQDVDSGFVLNVTPPVGSTSVTYTIKSVVDNSNPGCFTETDVAVTLDVVPDLNAVVETPIICDDTATTYTVDIAITGGDPATYKVDGVLTGTPFTSQAINTGNPYLFVVSDNSGCPDTVLTGSNDCACLTEIGNMTSTADFGKIISICGNQTIDFSDAGIFGTSTVYSDASQFLDPNDTLLFIVTGDEFNPMNDIKQVLASDGVNNVSPFTYSDLTGVNFGDTVYIAAIVGNKADLVAGNYNNDRCFKFSETFGIVWFNSSVAGWAANMDTEVCFGDTVRLKVEFRDANGNLVNYTSLIEDFDIEYNKNSFSINENVVKEDIPDNPFVSILDTLTESTTYTLIQFADENNGLCSSIDPVKGAITVSILSLPNVEFTVEDSTTCVGESIDFFPFNPTTPNLTYEWDFTVDSAYINLPSQIFPDSGLFDVSLTITDTITGCVAVNEKEDFMDVQAIPNVGFDGLPPSPICINEVFTLTDTSNVADFGGREWSVNGAVIGNGNTQDFTFDPAQSYTIQLTDTTTYGCTGFQREVVAVSGPNGEITFDKTAVCLNEQFQVTLVNLSTGITDIQITGEDGSTFSGNTFPHSLGFYPADGNYRITAILTNGDGCTRTISAEIIILDPVAEFTLNGDIDSTVVCENEPVNFQYTGGSIAGLQLDWDVFADGSIDATNVSSITRTFSGASPVSVALTVTEQHCSNTITHNVILKPLPIVTVDYDVPCLGNILTIVASGADEYVFSPAGNFASQMGDTAFTNPLGATLTFDVIGTDTTLDCSFTLPVVINAFDILPPLVVEYDTIIHIGDTVFYNVTQMVGANPDDRYNYEWTPETGAHGCLLCPEAEFGPLFDQEYSVRVYDDVGCYDQRFTFNIEVDRMTTIDVPDAFTPNGDNVNDIIFPFGFGSDELLEFSIYNRWGVVVFSSDSPTAGWDGKFNGEDQPVDSYVYVVRMKTLVVGEVLEKRGTIRLMR